MARAGNRRKRRSRIRWPFVRRSMHERTVEAQRDRYDVLWLDHLARCGCHDSWDQCEHTSSGHKEPLPEGRSLYEPCGCCRWC